MSDSFRFEPAPHARRRPRGPDAHGPGGTFLLLGRLPALPPGRAYQLWALDGTGPVSLTVRGDDTTGPQPLALPPGTDHVAISEEPAAGATSPTGIVATGTLTPPQDQPPS